MIPKDLKVPEILIYQPSNSSSLEDLLKSTKSSQRSKMLMSIKREL
jgi:hypothetical protein